MPAAREQIASVPQRVLEMHGRQREAYLRYIEAALEIYAELGYERASAACIVARAKGSTGSFYNNFANHAACFLDVYETVVGRIAEALRAADSPSQHWPDRLKASIEAILDLIEERPGMVRVVLIEPTAAGAWAGEHHRSRLALLPPLLDEGRSLSLYGSQLPPHTGAMALGSATTLLIEEHRRGFKRSREHLARDLYFALLMPYVGPADAERMTSSAYP
jgi:AcrR family transcriptional regulator